MNVTPQLKALVGTNRFCHFTKYKLYNTVSPPLFGCWLPW